LSIIIFVCSFFFFFVVVVVPFPFLVLLGNHSSSGDGGSGCADEIPPTFLQGMKDFVLNYIAINNNTPLSSSNTTVNVITIVIAVVLVLIVVIWLNESSTILIDSIHNISNRLWILLIIIVNCVQQRL